MGLLESGKTTGIKKDIANGLFAGSGKTLLLQCEDGSERIDDSFLEEHDIVRRFVLSPFEYKKEKLVAIDGETEPSTVILESQGIWPLRAILRQLPDDWTVTRRVMFADAADFMQQYRCMEALVGERLRFAEELNVRSADAQSCEEIQETAKLYNKNIRLNFY